MKDTLMICPWLDIKEEYAITHCDARKIAYEHPVYL